MRQKLYCLSLLWFLVAVQTSAEESFPTLTVDPWNGHKAATSFTFDDGDPSHLDVVVPELNQRHMKGTFFLIANRIDRKDDWRKILAAGHEIGNHTLDHKHANELTPQDEEAQVVGAQNVLQKEFGVTVDTFAYPYTEITPGLKAQVEKTNLLARGGYGANFEITPDQDIDWMNIPSRTTMTLLPFSTYQTWIETDFNKGGWLVWMIHGLEGTPWGWEPIKKKIFEQILDAVQAKDIWEGTFLEVGSYLRAQKIFEKSAIQKTASEETWTWVIPDHLHSNVILKLKVRSGSKMDDKNIEIWQGIRKLSPDEKGDYSVDFSQEKLIIRLTAKN